MVTIIDWPYSILVVIILTIGIFLAKRTIRNWPPKLNVIDLMVLPMLWSLQCITFQMNHFSLVGPLVFMFLLWGIALAIYQTFGLKTFRQQQFFINWWRIVGVTTVIIYVVMIGLTQVL